MSVVTIREIQVLPVANNDRRLPLAFYVGICNSTGDATGGSNTARITIPAVGNRLYSLDEFSGSSGSAGIVHLLIVTGEPGPAALQFAHDFAINFDVTAEGAFVTRGADILQVTNMLPFQPGRGGNDGRIELIRGNTNGEQLELRIKGYIWDAAALQLPGGPVRPGLVPLRAPEKGFRRRRLPTAWVS